ncbi:hypothetical protein ACFE04_019146 [Oxalis oulophora]
MEQPLLLSSSNNNNKGTQQQPKSSVLLLTWGVLLEEVKRLGYIAGPMVAATVSQYLLQIISMVIVGHLGELALSSTAIAISLAGVTGFSLLDECVEVEDWLNKSNGMVPYDRLYLETLEGF